MIRLLKTASGRGLIFASICLAYDANAFVGLCNRNAFASDIKRITTPVRNYTKGIRRFALSAPRAKKVMASKSAEQIRRAVGAVFCPEDGPFKQVAGTAFVMGKSDEIVTTGHFTTSPDGTQRDLSKCFFENFDIPPQRIFIDANNARNLLPPQAPQLNDRLHDRARLVLKTPVPSVKPLTASSSGEPLKPGEQLILVTAQNKDFKTDGKDPIVTTCSARNVEIARDGVTRVKMDCDLDGGASGGPIFTVEDGELVVRAMAVSKVDTRLPDHSPYEETSNYSFALGMDRDLLSWVKK